MARLLVLHLLSAPQSSSVLLSAKHSWHFSSPDSQSMFNAQLGCIDVWPQHQITATLCSVVAFAFWLASAKDQSCLIRLTLPSTDTGRLPSSQLWSWRQQQSCGRHPRVGPSQSAATAVLLHICALQCILQGKLSCWSRRSHIHHILPGLPYLL